jgi:hypothetical protein
MDGGRTKVTAVKRYGRARSLRDRRVTEVLPAYTKDQVVGPAHQLSLFNSSTKNSGVKNGGAFRDPAFYENKNLPVHRWVPWIAGFSATFVDSVCADYLRPANKSRKSLVLDPFAGVGTTLLQAVLRGHDAIGFEINPYAALAASTKLQALTTSLKDLDVAIEAMRRAAKNWRTASPPRDVAPPPLRTRIPFFSARVERQVLHALAFVSAIREGEIADLFRTAFGSVIVSVSNYTYEPSLGSRPGAGKPLVEDADVGMVLLNKLHQIRADVAWLKEETKASTRLGTGRVINGSFFSTNERLESGSIDLMVTSPPYMNNYHYVRNTRPQLYWMSFISSPEEQRILETDNFGKYWQTVRDAQDLPLSFEHRGLEDIVKQLRETRRTAGAYGGPGWANYVAAYFNDCHQFMGVLRRVLSRGGVGVVVIGNSIIQGMEIRVDEILGDIAVHQGLRLEGIPRIRGKRVGASITQSSVRRGHRNSATLYESAVMVRRP